MNAPPPLPPPPAGTRPNLRHAFGGIWRLTWHRMTAPGRWVVAVVLLAALGLLSSVAVPEGDAPRFFEWASGFYLTALVPVAAFLAGAGAIRDDMKPGTVDYILTRPVPRPAFVVFRYVSHLACAQLVGMLALLVVMGAGLYRHVPELASVAPRLLLAQVAGIGAFLALGMLCGALTSRYLVLGLLYGGIVEVGLGRIPIQLNRLSILHHLRLLLHGASGTGAEGPSAATTVGLLVIVALGLTAAAAAAFSLRELVGEQPKDA